MTHQTSMFVTLNVPIIAENSDQYHTPLPIIDAARATMGSIDLDPASNPIANKRIQAGTYYTITNDGLSRQWIGNVWLNGPYSKLLPWVAKLEASPVSQYIALVPERAGVEWFNRLVILSDAMCLFSERIHFERPNGSVGTSPNFGNVAFYSGNRVLQFRNYFKQFGHVLPCQWQ